MNLGDYLSPAAAGVGLTGAACRVGRGARGSRGGARAAGIAVPWRMLLADQDPGETGFHNHDGAMRGEVWPNAQFSSVFSVLGLWTNWAFG